MGKAPARRRPAVPLVARRSTWARAGTTLFQQHPEYFALRDGKRSLSQLCIANPDVLKLTIESTKQFFRDNPDADIIGMGANDGRGFCECDKCKALDARRL